MNTKIHEFKSCILPLMKDEKLFYGSGNQLFIWDVGTREKLSFKLNEELGFIRKSNNKIWLTNSKNQQMEIHEYDVVATKLNLGVSDLRISQVQGNHLKFYTRGEEAISGIYNIDKRDIVFKDSNFMGTLYSPCDLLYLYDNIIRYDIESGNELWRNNINLKGRDELTVQQYLGAVDDRFYVTLSTGAVVEILRKTGNCINEWKWFDQRYHSHSTISMTMPIKRYQESLSNFSIRTAKLIPALNKIVGFEYGVFWEIDLKTGTIAAYSMYEHFNKYDISGCWSGISFNGNRLYFFSDQAFSINNNNHKLVVFDLDTRTIVDSWQLPKDSLERRGFIISGPIMTEQYLIALEQSSKCHLFKIR